MEGGSEGEIDRNMNQSPTDGSKRPKRQMKTPFQLEMLEKTYSMEMYPSEATRAELSEKLALTDRQLQMWFCHRRLKDKKEAVGMAAMKPRTPGSVNRRDLTDSPRDEPMADGPGNGPGSGSGSESESGSDSDSSQFNNGDDVEMVPLRYYESNRVTMEQRVIACVEAQLKAPLREDGPIIGVEFDELPPGAFGSPIVPAEQRERFRHSYDSIPYGQYDAKHIKAAATGHHEVMESKVRSNAYLQAGPSYLYESRVDGPSARISPLHGNGHLPRGIIEGQVSSEHMLTHPLKQVKLSASPRSTDLIAREEDNIHLERKRKYDEDQSGRDVQAPEKKFRKEVEKLDILKRKREEQMRKEMERQDRERRKEEQRMMRERQKLEEKFQREEKREMERREKFMQKELLRVERRKQKEAHRKEREAARQKAAAERATARKIAKESMELIEDERLELMELAAAKKGVNSIVALDYDTLHNLDAFRDALCEFPPKSVKLKMPFTIQPWNDSEENVGNLLMVYKFCVTFADVLGLWPFTLDEFIQAFHDYNSRLLGEIHISILKLIVKDIEDVVRTPSGGPGTNQYSAVNPEGGHPRIVEGAYMWGFDIRDWQRHLNPLTWPEILRQFAVSAGLGPQLKKKGMGRVSTNDIDESKGCEDIVSTLRNGSAAVNAVAVMQEKGFTLQRKSRHRLTPGTVKFAAYHVLALEGPKGLNVIELAEKIQKSGLRDLSTSKTPEASISVALSRDPILFERVAPSTYCVRPAFRKDPADAESIIATAKEKIQRYANGFLPGQNVDEEEREDESDIDSPEGAEADALATPSDSNKLSEVNEFGLCSGNEDKNGGSLGNSDQGVQGVVEIDDSISGESWVQGITEGEYSDLSVEERLNALVALIGVANEGNSIRVILEDRLDAANALKKQMWAEAQLDKRRMREEIITKFCDAYDPSATPLEKDEPEINNSIDNQGQGQPNGCTTERSRLQLKSYIGHRAEEMCVYRSLPLGQDRRRNRYWQFVASRSTPDPGSGRIFVELPEGNWRLIDSEEAFDALLTSLDTRGTRESHLHIMLQKIEASFKERVNKKRSSESPLSSTESRNNTNSDELESSDSFKIELARNETEKNNFLKRYEDLQIWTWKECFSAAILRAKEYGKKRCLPVLGICELCFGTYDAKEELCPCHSDAPPLIRLIKAMLTLIEVSVPSEGLHSSWTEEIRNTWGLKLHKSSSCEDLLQILTQFEGSIKRDYLSSEFETTGELLSFCATSSKGSSYGFGYPFSSPQLPWIPETTAAVALRLLELDASIFYTPDQRPEAHEEKKQEAIPKVTVKYAYTKDIHNAETMEFDRHGFIKEEKWDVPGSSEYKPVVRGKGGRPRGSGKKSQKGAKLPIPQSSIKQGETLAQILMQQSVRSNGRGRRTVRKRRTETKGVAAGTLQDYLGDSRTFENVPERHQDSGFSARNVVVEKDDTEESDSDEDNGNVNLYEFEKWGDVIPNRSDEVMEEMSEEEEEDGDEIEENGYDLDERGNFEEINDDGSDREEDVNRDDGSESSDSGEYSD